MPNIFDYVSAKEIALYIKNLPTESTLDKQLFPADKQYGMEIELAKGAKQKPVALSISSFDVNVRPRVLKATVDIEKRDMPFMKESILINEKERQKLMLAIQANNQNIIDQILSTIYENYKVLVDGAEVQMRRMRAQLIQNGTISISSENGDVVVDYNVPSEHKATISTSTKKWNVATADIVGDIIKWQKVFTNEGYAKPTVLVLTDTCFGYVCQNTAIVNDIKGMNTNYIVTENDIKNYLQQKFGLTVAVVNGTFVNEGGETVSYYEDNKVTLIPKGTLGKTVYGTTPEEADSVFGSGKLDTQIVNTGVAITTMTKEDPVNVETKVSQLGMPSFEKADECFFATVY
ncbi:major capsid protein [Clostridium saudiense]|uniref:major capsid protein n=1 Tax=Clostridium saudiense TaxID=1414720 RepID=UPI0026727CAE|nr:major capsid protein [Clostridium saudiense]